mmetsp:Transcript_10206/g.19976  ORF Transcript_10206/g.19976 Transcript_10206/m.19976 type:complete len:243 (-) Transcript_10206:27-755(-)
MHLDPHRLRYIHPVPYRHRAQPNPSSCCRLVVLLGLARHGVDVEELPVAAGVLLGHAVDGDVEGLVLVGLAHDRLALLLGLVLVERLAERVLADLDDLRLVGSILGVHLVGNLDAGRLVLIRILDALLNVPGLGGDVDLGPVSLLGEVVVLLELRGEVSVKLLEHILLGLKLLEREHLGAREHGGSLQERSRRPAVVADNQDGRDHEGDPRSAKSRDGLLVALLGPGDLSLAECAVHRNHLY